MDYGQWLHNFHLFSGTQKTINISKLLHITSVEQSFRTVILIEFILDSIYYKKYGKFYINK